MYHATRRVNAHINVGAQQYTAALLEVAVSTGRIAIMVPVISNAFVKTPRRLSPDFFREFPKVRSSRRNISAGMISEQKN